MKTTTQVAGQNAVPLVLPAADSVSLVLAKTGGERVITTTIADTIYVPRENYAVLRCVMWWKAVDGSMWKVTYREKANRPNLIELETGLKNLETVPLGPPFGLSCIQGKTTDNWSKVHCALTDSLGQVYLLEVGEADRGTPIDYEIRTKTDQVVAAGSFDCACQGLLRKKLDTRGLPPGEYGVQCFPPVDVPFDLRCRSLSLNLR